MTIDAMNNFIIPHKFSPISFVGIIFYLILMSFAYTMYLIFMGFSYLYTNETIKRKELLLTKRD